ncbi:permease-like cell division protein FtsX [Proteiniborus sp. MB09-C3]|uniref:cell division protein FtsX n=1 Tax=Proteiniborus sp. MB09-C3 TaxID=3050072 RepID=UPI00255343D9|nr:permease-like cell division protein FtsX [Proteiniborus sp. MB09-C3]WIV13810.1 permease-like cell division protein FtsX [Proteiniborus sp. MB09-C3]
MKSIFKNIGYFLKETKTILILDFLSNIFSILSMGFIFFMLSMVVSGVWISSQMVELIKEEAEINVYYDEKLEDTQIHDTINQIEAIDGVREARIIDKEKAYDRMMEIMGENSGILKFFDHNPFSAFIEVKIELDEMDSIVEKIERISDVDYIKDNQSVLNRLRSISNIVRVLGILIVSAVGISTLVITSHIIRQGIYSNKEQINTLRLLGAPESFIVLPFFLEGLFLTLIAAIFAVAMGILGLKYIYIQTAGPLPFIPLPALDNLIKGNIIMILSVSIILGIIGSFFGLASADKN